MTNYEYAKTLSVEEFAHFIDSGYCYDIFCVNLKSCHSFKNCEKCIVDYLKSEHKESEGD